MKRLFLTLLGLMVFVGLFAQTVKVTGKVTDATGQALIGVNVSSQSNKSLGTITDANGNFTLNTSVGDKLTVSYVGYEKQVVAVTSSSKEINVTLSEDDVVLNEMVVIGYGTAKKKDLTGSVATVSAKELEKTPFSSFTGALQGKAAGVQVNLSDNSPGGGVSVLIRGQGSINQSNAPIYVVDGVIMEGTLQNVNVNDIASIDILKDASAAAIYGSRAANGVVIVTTKRGKTGNAKVSYSGRVSFQQEANRPKMLNAQQLAEMRIEGNVNSQLDYKWYSNPNMTMDEYRTDFYALKEQYMKELPSSMFSEVERNTLLAGETYDWYNQISRTGITNDHTVSVSGATDKTNYYVSLNYFKQDGMVKGTEFRRLSFRTNLEQQVKSWMKVGVNAAYTDALARMGGASLGNAIAANPMYPFKIDGNDPLTLPYYTAQGQANPVLSQKIQNDSKNYRFSMNAYVQFDITPYLKWKSSMSLDQVHTFAGWFAPSDIYQGQATQGEAQIKNDTWTDFMQENNLTFDKVFNEDHHLTVLVGNTLQTNNYFGNTQYGYGFATNVMGYNNIGAASNIPVARQGSSKTRWSLASFMGRINYAFQDKYLLTVTGRYDGNSRFGANNKWGFFPSIAAAWRISGEEFMKDLTWINDLKLRVGYGESGNSTSAAYASFTKLSPGVTVDYQGKPVNTIMNTDQYMGNPDLRWERQQQINAGLDFTAFHNRFHMTVDVYKKNSKDLILTTALPVTTGYLNIFSNVGELENKGVEVSLGGRIIDTKDFSWDFDVNWTHNANKLVALYGGLDHKINDASNPTGAGWWVGKPLGVIYGYRYEGLWQWDDDREAMDMLKDGWKGGDTYYPGENKIKDLDGDGVITTEDREIIGYTDPKFYGGFTTTFRYKNLSLNMAFNYVYGNDVWNRSYHEYTLNAGYGTINLREDALQRWTVDNTNTDMPRAHSNNLNRMAVSSRLVQDGSYLRCKVATLNYQVPATLINRIGLSDLNVYVSAENFFTLTKYKGQNPESVSAGYDESYPNARSFAFGVNLSF